MVVEEVDITNLTAGVSYKFRVRYEQGAGGANLYLKWKSPEDVAAGAAFGLLMVIQFIV